MTARHRRDLPSQSLSTVSPELIDGRNLVVVTWRVVAGPPGTPTTATTFEDPVRLARFSTETAHHAPKRVPA